MSVPDTHMMTGEEITGMFNTAPAVIIFRDDFGMVSVVWSHELRKMPKEEREKVLLHFSAALRLETGWRPGDD